MKKENQDDWLKNILEVPAETQTIEFKRLADERVVAKTIETVVAMANTEGGSIILGVDDPEKTKLRGFDRIFGIDENIDVFDALGREIQKIIPPITEIWPPKILEANNKRM